MRDHTHLVADLGVKRYSAIPRENSPDHRQMRRAAVSIPSNIVEGCARVQKQTTFTSDHRYGSAQELHYQIALAHELGFHDQPDGQPVLLSS